MFNKICIIGIGLIGGSIARAAREQGLCSHIVAYGRKSGLKNLQKALDLGVIDSFYMEENQAQAQIQVQDLILDKKAKTKKGLSLKLINQKKI